MANERCIFAVTALNEEGHVQCVDPGRTFGWFAEYDTAEEAVLHNEGDIHENYYTHVVIERVREGIHPLARDQWWFAWSVNAWIKCAKPQWAERICNWSIG